MLPQDLIHSVGTDEAVELARFTANLVIVILEKLLGLLEPQADNLAIKGIANFHKTKGKHIITSKIEHKAVLDP